METTKHNANEIIRTRASLIQRLKDWKDDNSWNEFFGTYWRLIYGVARRAGLTDMEAQEVVQETMISVSKHMPTFRYDPSIGSFKAWLLNMTRWRVIGQLRKRRPEAHRSPGDSAARTDTVEALPDPQAKEVDEAWEQEWRSNILEVAKEKLRHHADPHRYQVFDFYVNKEWPADKVAQHFAISVDQVYQIKHRMTEALKEQVARLTKEME
jgi:RNA polymerase sigma-70 factor (ECF subfamily)